MNRTKLTAVGAVLTASALVLSACGGGGSSDPEASEGTQIQVAGAEAPAEYEGQEGGEISIGGCSPQNPLIPGNTQEVCGGDVLDAILKGLTEVDNKTKEPRLANAESIELNDDKSVATVTLKDGWKFTDGSPVTAESYTKAWSWAASGANGQSNTAFFGPGYLNVKGYADIAKSKDKDAQLEGLKVTGDNTFTIETDGPNALLQSMLVHSAFVPLPDSFFDDPEAFGKEPVGNGPFAFESWTPDKEIVLTGNKDYQGTDKAKVDKLTYKIYADPGAEYADVIASNTDYSNRIPPDAVAGNKWQTDAGEGRWWSQPGNVWQGFSFPQYDEKFKDPKVRMAISMAMDRAAISQVVSEGANTPATAWSPFGVEPYQEGICGAGCETNAEEAKKLLEEGGGFEGTLTLGFNADGAGNKEVAEAVATSINENLGIKAQAESYPTFAEMLDKIDSKEMTGMYRSAWQADYPSPLSYLTSYYITDAGSNKTDYSSEVVDKAANDVLSQDAAGQEKSFTAIQEQLAKDMPVTPLWYRGERAVWSDKAVVPAMTWKATLDYTSLGLK